MAENEPRWGVWFSGPHEYESAAEARKQLVLAQMDTPARLIVDFGDGWRDAEHGHLLGKAGLEADIKLLDEYAKTAPEDIDGALVSVTGKLEAVAELLERRKRFMVDSAEREKKALDDGDSDLAARYGTRAITARQEIGRLERILYDA